MATETRVTCDICGTLLLPTESGDMPWSPETHFDSVRIVYQYNEKDAGWDLCPRCVKRMKKYLRKHGGEMDGDKE